MPIPPVDNAALRGAARPVAPTAPVPPIANPSAHGSAAPVVTNWPAPGVATIFNPLGGKLTGPLADMARPSR